MKKSIITILGLLAFASAGTKDTLFVRGSYTPQGDYQMSVREGKVIDGKVYICTAQRTVTLKDSAVYAQSNGHLQDLTDGEKLKFAEAAFAYEDSMKVQREKTAAAAKAIFEAAKARQAK